MAMARNKFAFLTAGLVLAITFTLSCSGDDGDKDEGGGVNLSCPVSDVSENSVTCGGETYPTVVIGTQTWLAKNLNYAIAGSKCYGEGGKVIIDYDEDGNRITKTLSPAEVQDNCAKYGKLYDWNIALTVCTKDWHLPSQAEWGVLGSDAKKLKAPTGWVGWHDGRNVSSYNGTDDYGFSALPGGWGLSYGDFGSFGVTGNWWSTSEQIYFCMSFDADNAEFTESNTYFLLSIRCLKD
jgi:uncharacterized protein (TIGR02145 family)